LRPGGSCVSVLNILGMRVHTDKLVLDDAAPFMPLRRQRDRFRSQDRDAGRAALQHHNRRLPIQFRHCR